MKLNIIQVNLNNGHQKRAIISFSQDSLDAGNVKEFRDQIAPHITDNLVLYLDMSNLNFVDSSGLGALLSCMRNMNSKNGQLRLFGVNKPVMALLELVRMHRIFSIYPSIAEAQCDAQAA